MRLNKSRQSVQKGTRVGGIWHPVERPFAMRDKQMYMYVMVLLIILMAIVITQQMYVESIITAGLEKCLVSLARLVSIL